MKKTTAMILAVVVSVMLSTTAFAFSFEVELVGPAEGGAASDSNSTNTYDVPEIQIDENGWVIGYVHQGNPPKRPDPTDTFSPAADWEEKPSWQEEAYGDPEAPDTSGFENEVIRLVNIEREKAGLDPVASAPTLSQMAVTRALEINTLETYSHTRPDGRIAYTIFDDFETELEFCGENISMGRQTPEAVVESWMNSEGHKRNILRENAKYLGVGTAIGPHNWVCWVQLFAE